MAVGLPGLTGVDHFGFTVPDLDQAKSFLVDVLGCKLLYSLGAFERDGAWMTEHLNVDPGTRTERQHFFSCGGKGFFEVFQYSVPDQGTVEPRNSDIGGHHVSFYVDDLDAAVAYLRQQGVAVQGEPTVSGGATEGQRWVYFLAPWGMQFELVSYPGDKAFERPGWAEADSSHDR